MYANSYETICIKILPKPLSGGQKVKCKKNGSNLARKVCNMKILLSDSMPLDLMLKSMILTGSHMEPAKLFYPSTFI